jgi:DNA-binding NtrC family response regulator
VDFDRLMRLLTQSVTYAASKRPRILHVDEDDLIARALGEIADVVTVNSIEAARRALMASDFDLAVLDLALANGVGPDLLPELRDSKGNVIPVIVFGGNAANLADEAQKRAALTESLTSIESLVATVRERLESRRRASPEKLYA